SSQLFGVTHFVKAIELPDVLKKAGVTEEAYLDGRLHSAKKLVRYIILSSLRSSRAAVIEHISGTEKAKKIFGLNSFHKNTSSGNVIQQIMNLAGKVPENKLNIKLPLWLSDPQEHEKACRNDLGLYRKIANCVEQMSDTRERNK